MLLAWLALRQDRELLDALQGLVSHLLVSHLPQALAGAELEQLSNQLAQEVPALAPALRNAARANLRGDAEESARWRDEIARVSDEHREQVDNFFRRHPEVETLIATGPRLAQKL